MKDLDLRMKDLATSIHISRETKSMQDMISSLNGEISAMSGDLNRNENSIQGLLSVLLAELSHAEETVEEMRSGSEPDHGADYWDFRKSIQKYT
jgi:hypothetical protein